MINFENPTKENLEKIKEIVYKTSSFSSDTSFLNIYLLQKKYSLKVGFVDNFLIRKYTGPMKELGRDGITFPIGKGDSTSLLRELFKEAKKVCGYLKLCLVNELQKDVICKMFSDVEIIKYDGDSDYIYDANELANLSGRKFHKKKNHVSRFKRTYGHYDFFILDKKNPNKKDLEDLLFVEEEWLRGQEKVLHSMLVEKYEIQKLIEEWKDLSFIAGILRVGRTPVAMSIASNISKNVYDIHFEKSYAEYVKNGAYAVINQEMAKYLKENGATYINREEDIGDLNLRKAKLSYNPIHILEKYTLIIRG